MKESTLTTPVAEKTEQVKGIPFSTKTLKPGDLNQTEFSAIIPILKGQEKALFTLLSEWGKQLSQKPFLPFEKLNRIHYCRFFVVDEALNADGSFVPPQLVFSMIADGNAERNLEILYNEGREALDKIFSFTSGYPSGASDQAKVEFLFRNRHVEPLFWTARRYGTVDIIRNEGRLRDEIQDFLDGWQKKEDLSKKSAREVYDGISRHLKSKKDFTWAFSSGMPELSPLKKWFYRNPNGNLKTILIIAGILLFPLTILAAVFVGCWFLLARYFEVKYNRSSKPPARKPLHDVVEYEDRVFQNQLTIYGTLKKPFWFYHFTLKTFLRIANLKMKLTAVEGNLSGIATIHFVSWVFFNRNRNVMFLSNYDGGWESYLNEFIDEAASVMNLSFGSMIDYPPTRWIFKEGAHDEQKFKAVVRDHQYPCPIWYSAYPMLSIRNIMDNSKIREGIASPPATDTELQFWLSLL